ncbi:hypothetical protein [Leifsonia sp. EB34]|uniref:hypothetical protein n=1 Tax=Leifsonia sp. EB34 TaxID=3156303 RepID=UPI0035162157
MRKPLSVAPLVALLVAGLAGCSAIGPQPTEWVADTSQGAVYLSWTSTDGKLSGNESSSSENNYVVSTSSAPFTGTESDGKVTLDFGSALMSEAFTGKISNTDLHLTGTNSNGTVELDFKPGTVTQFKAAVAKEQDAATAAQTKAAIAAAQHQYDGAVAQLAPAVDAAQTALDTEQAALATEKQAMAVYASQVATAVSSGCSNSDASNAATGPEQGPPGDAAYALQTATDGLSKAASALTDAINAVNPPPSKIAATVSQATLSADSDLASRATTAAQQDGALASSDNSGIFTQGNKVWNLPYC